MLAQVADSPSEEVATTLPVRMSLFAATDLQDHLMIASNDLERLQGLLDDASQTLASSSLRCPTSSRSSPNS